MIKKINMLILLILLFSLPAGCGNTGEMNIIATAEPSFSIPVPSPVEIMEGSGKPINIDFLSSHFNYDQNPTQKEYQEWISREYGINFIMHNRSTCNYTEVINMAVASKDLKGIVQLFTYDELKEWKESNRIYSLTDFLKENEVFNTTYPEQWKEAYTIDGEVWALAQGSDMKPTMFARTIRGDWLETLGLKKPETVWELYEASFQFTYNDPDGNGIDDTFGMTSRTAWLMQDIFQAFDARLNHIGDAVPAWNPNTNLWEDSMLKPEMAECLELLKKMTAENVLDKEIYTQTSSVAREKVKNGYYGGMFYWDTWIQSFETSVKANFPDAWMEGIYALKGNIDQRINQYNVNIGCPMVMTAYTPQPKETINWYLNIFYGSAKGVFRGEYGIQGMFEGEETFTLSDDKLILNFYEKDGIIKSHSYPYIVGGHPEYAVGTVYELVYNSPDKEWNAVKTAETNSGILKRNNWFEEASSWNGVYHLPESLKEPDSEKYLDIAGLLATNSSTAIQKAISGEVTVNEALENYRIMAKQLGAQEVLDLANQALGMVSSQEY